MTREEMLERLSLICARPITSFGDLTPAEIEATLRSEWERPSHVGFIRSDGTVLEPDEPFLR